LTFSGDGDLVRTEADRPRLESDNAIVPWTGSYSDHRVVGDVRIPTHAEVRWELPDGPFTYWRSAITSLEMRN
jgi:hypothetical protein